jgi:hypothetical protein
MPTKVVLYFPAKPLDPAQVTEAVDRLLAHIRPFESASSGRPKDPPEAENASFDGTTGELLPVKDLDRDKTTRSGSLLAMKLSR